ncbi:MAG: hypothetical protein PVH91_13130 [Pseudomonadales bacterium]|jgi:hypothetical protein
MSERPTRVHVVGCYRSGTTLMMELLWYAYPFTGRSEHEASIFRPVPSGERLYLSKKPPDTIRIETAFLADERLHVIAMVRDPRAVATSRHPDFPDVYFSSFRRWLEYQSVIEKLSGHPRWHTVRYEDLLADPDSEQAAIEAAFPFLERRRSFSAYPDGADVPARAGISLGGARPLDPGRTDAWRAHLPRIRAQLEDHPEVADALIDLGYEPDDAWRACLEGVMPVRQTYKDDAPHFFKRQETRARYWLKTRRYLRSL